MGGCMEEFRCCQMKAGNPCASRNGGCAHTCRNNNGRAVCSCRAGFKAAGTRCNDINECKVNNGGCAHGCTNTAGSFKCGCKKGFVLAANGKSCNDINECKVNNGGCAHGCTNTAGSFKCGCKKGFVLAANGKSCRATNACRVANGGCGHHCESKNGVAVCSCKKGFNLLPNGKQCTPFEIVTEGTVTYLNIDRARCTSVTKEECTKIAKSHGIPLRKIINPNFNRFPPGCYHKRTSNVVYFNDKPSTKSCTTRRVCICKPGTYSEQTVQDEIDEEMDENLMF